MTPHDFSSGAALPVAAISISDASPLPEVVGIAASNSLEGNAADTASPFPGDVKVSAARSRRYANTFSAAADSFTQLSSVITAFIEGFVMRSVYEEKIAVASENARQIRQGAAKIVRPKFGAVAKLLWPHKTAACLAVIGKSNERTAARWLSGEFAPPISVVIAVNQEIFGEYE